MIGTRTRLSLAQYLSRQRTAVLDVLFDKHHLTEGWVRWRDLAPDRLEALAGILREAPPDRVQGLAAEVVATAADLRDNVVDGWGNGAAAYQARWDDLVRCLALDDYAVSREHRLIAIQPELAGAHHVEDDLTAELRRSGLPHADGIITLLDQSADAFRQSNYSTCLSAARAALETLGADIALARQPAAGGSFQADKWGQVAAYLRTSGLIAGTDEALICAIYTFISPGAHRPVALAQEEMVRLGRGMAVSGCYYFVRLHNG